VFNFFPENRNVYEIMWKNNVKLGRQHTHADYTWDNLGHKYTLGICNIALLLHQRLHERASMLRYTHITRLVSNFHYGEFRLP
jgi:hypothetical protein